jgi:hypothetical protein
MRPETDAHAREPAPRAARDTYRWHDVATVRVDADDPVAAARIAAQLGLVPTAATADAIDLDIRVSSTTNAGATPENEPAGRLALQCASGARLDSSAYLSLHALALERDVWVLHASAFAWRGRLILVVGDGGAGKTAVLLASVLAGAQPVAAEWVSLGGGRARAAAGADAYRIRPWHLDAMPGLDALLSPHEGRRLRASAPASRLLRGIPPRIAARVSMVQRLERRLFVDVDAARFATAAAIPERARIVFLAAGTSPTWSETPLPRSQAVGRLVALALADDRRWCASSHDARAAGIAARLERMRLPARLESLLDGVDTARLQVPRRDLAASAAAWLERMPA